MLLIAIRSVSLNDRLEVEYRGWPLALFLGLGSAIDSAGQVAQSLGPILCLLRDTHVSHDRNRTAQSFANPHAPTDSRHDNLSVTVMASAGGKHLRPGVQPNGNIGPVTAGAELLQ